MKKRGVYQMFCVLIALASLCLPTMEISAEENVALGKSVTLYGTMNGAAGSTLTDGIFLGRGTSWTSGTVWWNGTSAYAEIDLNGKYVINSMIAQADDNDAYLITYHDVLTGTWQTAWNVPNYDAYGSGMQTRPNPANHNDRYALASAITADALRFYAVSGDNSYSVSEIQAYGNKVPTTAPEPTTMLLLGLGLAGVAGIRRKMLK